MSSEIARSSSSVRFRHSESPMQERITEKSQHRDFHPEVPIPASLPLVIVRSASCSIASASFTSVYRGKPAMARSVILSLRSATADVPCGSQRKKYRRGSCDGSGLVPSAASSGLGRWELPAPVAAFSCPLLFLAAPVLPWRLLFWLRCRPPFAPR